MSDLLTDEFENTWSAGETALIGGLLVCRDDGAGGRLSSIRRADSRRRDDPLSDLDAALAQQREWGQRALVRAWDDDEDLIAAASAKLPVRAEPTVVLSAAIDALADEAPPVMTSFGIWPPMAVQRQLWQDFGINAARQAVMSRGTGPRLSLLGRLQDKPAGVGFCAVSGTVAGLHALVVKPDMRGARLGEWLVREAAHWAAHEGAEQMMLAVGRDNAAALRLYDRLGFKEVGGYAYYRDV